MYKTKERVYSTNFST
nr:unnamed protein product [Callosobruchus chinensis]